MEGEISVPLYPHHAKSRFKHREPLQIVGSARMGSRPETTVLQENACSAIVFGIRPVGRRGGSWMKDWFHGRSEERRSQRNRIQNRRSGDKHHAGRVFADTLGDAIGNIPAATTAAVTTPGFMTSTTTFRNRSVVSCYRT